MPPRPQITRIATFATPRKISRTIPIHHTKPTAQLFSIYPTTRSLNTPSTMSTTHAPTPEGLKIENPNVNTAPGVTLTDRQRLLMGSVLDLFVGRPSLKKLQLWDDNAVFADGITTTRGRGEWAAQWYGLPAIFNPIERVAHKVTSAGQPITMDLVTKYTVKGVKTEKTMESVIKVWVNDKGLIERLEDQWGGELTDGPIKNASIFSESSQLMEVSC